MHTLVHVKNAYTVMTICLIALGAALLFMPQLGLKTMCMLYGVFLIIYGVTKLSGYFAKDLFQLAFQFDLALGIVSIVLGIIIIKKTEYIIEILSTAIGIFMLVDESWNKNQTLESAFKTSCVWCYKEFASKIDKNKYKNYLEELNYGNKIIGDNITDFWLDEKFGNLQLMDKLSF